MWHEARSSRIFDDEIYRLVFNENYPLAVYTQAITIQRVCENYLRQEVSTKGEVENFVFHLSTIAAIAMTRKRQPRPADLASIDSVPSNPILREPLPIVRHAFGEVVNSKNYVLFDQVAKDPMSTSRLLAGANEYLNWTRSLIGTQHFNIESCLEDRRLRL